MRTNRSSRPLVSLLVACFVALGVLVAGAVGAGAVEYPSDATLTVNDPTPACGQTVQVVGTGFLPDTTVTITIAGEVVGTTMSDADGNFTFPYTLPDPCISGEQLIRATDGTNTLLVSITVSSTTQTTATTPAAGDLPVTGSSDTSLHLAQAGVLLVAAGGILLMATRKRRRQDASV
jgi:LPXTG-motif cell wall-anchored protein